MPDATYPLEILIKKRDGFELSRGEIASLVHAIVRSHEARGTELPLDARDCISDAQIASFLMAVFQRGLSPRELADLTQAMRYSGETLDTGDLGGYVVDKHSTGGVGDKSSLLIAPILAAAGLEGSPSISVPMISGRSLGHTGGTLDKLETIPGFDTQLSLARMTEVLRACHAVLVGQTPRLVPADHILYALRDHTGTVESPYLITASIMSKKLAEGLGGLVLDVKVGSGAFMPSYEASRQLAELMVSTGERAGTRTVALLTRMDEPLGRFAGNWLEVWECVDILKGNRHSMSADLIELSLALAGHMLHLAGKSSSPEAGAKLADQYLRNGSAYSAWLNLVRAQGGDISVFDHPAQFHQPKASRIVRAPRAGCLASMNCKEVGWAVQRLGAGRSQPGDPVSAHAGIEVHAKIGAWLEAGHPIFTLFTEQPGLLDDAADTLEAAVVVSDVQASAGPLLCELISA